MKVLRPAVSDRVSRGLVTGRAASPVFNDEIVIVRCIICDDLLRIAGSLLPTQAMLAHLVILNLFKLFL